MARLDTMPEPLAAGKHVSRKGWKSTMYVDRNGQFKRTPNKGAKVKTGDYGWTLSLSDLTATDWQLAEPTSTPQQTLL